jgi:hypothetical protein
MDYKALFLDEYLNELGTKNFKPIDEFFTFKKGTFNIRLDAYLYRNKDVTYYAYIYPTDEKLLIDVRINPVKDDKLKTVDSARLIKLKQILEHGDLKLIIGENIIGQLARMAVMGLKTNWVLILIVAVAVGLGAGGIAYSVGVGNGVNQGFHQAQLIYNSTMPQITPIPKIG